MVRCDDGGDKVTASSWHDVILRSASPEGNSPCNQDVSSSRLSSGRSKAGTWDESSLILQANANWGIDVASSAMLSVLPAVTTVRIGDAKVKIQMHQKDPVSQQNLTSAAAR